MDVNCFFIALMSSSDMLTEGDSRLSTVSVFVNKLARAERPDPPKKTSCEPLVVMFFEWSLRCFHRISVWCLIFFGAFLRICVAMFSIRGWTLCTGEVQTGNA